MFRPMPVRVEVTADPVAWNRAWRECWAARDLLVMLFLRDLKLRYRQTYLGVVWIIGQALVSAIIFAAIFGRVAHLPSGGAPYVVFAFAGLTAWNLFSGTLARAGSSLQSNLPLVSKVYAPRLLLPTVGLAIAGTDLLVNLAVLAVMMAITDTPAGWHLVTLPLWCALLGALSLGLGLLTSSLSVRHRDLLQLVPLVLQVGFYVCPVAYGTQAIPRSFRSAYAANPLATLIDGFRSSILGTTVPSAVRILSTVVVVAIALVGGIAVFMRREPRFADVV